MFRFMVYEAVNLNQLHNKLTIAAYYIHFA